MRTEAAVEFDPASIEETWTSGPELHVTVTVINDGNSTFQANVIEGNASCTQSQDVIWLSLSPNHLAIPPLTSQSFSAALDPTGLDAGEYSATICVGQSPIPVSFTIAAAQSAIDEVFASGFEPVGYPVPLAAPEGPDRFYTGDVTIGNQVFALLVDTSSATLGVAGANCTSCKGLSPLYSPSSSATSTGHSASSQYGNGSGWSGAIFSDTVSLGNAVPSVMLDLVDIAQQSAFFNNGNEYQGILGLGPQQLALPNTTGYMPAASAAGLDNEFALELCENEGTLWIGGDGGAASAQRTPLVPITAGNPFYAINVDALSLGNTLIANNASNKFQQPVLSTNTSLFYVPSSVYQAFENALEASPEFTSLFGSNTFSGTGCVTDANVTDAQVESTLPHIALSLPALVNGQPDVTIQAGALDTYLYNAGGGQYCLAIQDGGTVRPSTFGVAFMQAFHIVVDVHGAGVGFSPPTRCAAVKPSRVSGRFTGGK